MTKKNNHSALPVNPAETAAAARLRYVNDEEPGYERKRWGKGFSYLSPNGERVRDKKLRARFASLAIPPAWADVWICLTPNGHIQAVGRDDQGRKQYIYHPRWEEVRRLVKFNGLVAFAEGLPQLRQQVEADLRRRNFSKEKLVALVTRLLEQTLIRIGNHEYAVQNGSYGLTTLLNDHAEVNGNGLTFNFPGKSGKQLEITLDDRRLANMVRQCQELPGQELFTYAAEDGAYQPITSTDVNAYLRDHLAGDFTAKEFRTWGGTVLATTVLARLGPAEDERAAESHIVAAIKEVAEALANTPAVCREYYIHPAILDAYRRGDLAQAVAEFRPGVTPPVPGLTEMETATLAILRRGSNG